VVKVNSDTFRAILRALGDLGQDVGERAQK